MSKFITLKTTIGSIWKIPADTVARNMADWFVSVNEKNVFEDEYRKAMGSNSDLIGWARYNMIWEELKDHAILCNCGKEDMQTELEEGEMSVIENDEF